MRTPAPSNRRSPLSRSHDHGDKAARRLRGVEIFLLLLSVLPHLAVATDAVKSTAIDPSISPFAGEPSAPAPAGGTDEALFLEVQVNGHSIGKIGEFTLRRGKLMARPDELRDLGFRIPDSRALASGGLMLLSDVPRSEERRVGKECRSRWSP